MLVSPLAFKIPFWSSVVVGGLCMAGRYVQWLRTLPLDELPVATAQPRRASLVWLRPLLSLGMVGGFVSAHTLWTHHCNVVLVRDGEHGLAVARLVWLGGAPPFHRADDLYVPDEPTWIVNVGQGYGGPIEWRVSIQPHTQTGCAPVDSIGPDHEPPERLSVPGSSYDHPDTPSPPYERWTWLTWGDTGTFRPRKGVLRLCDRDDTECCEASNHMPCS
jgi:hypothetical protein